MDWEGREQWIQYKWSWMLEEDEARETGQKKQYNKQTKTNNADA